jgi:hypothetical protein
MTGFGLSRRTRTFLLWTARLAFLAYFLQLSAVDHWHSHFSDVIGVEGTSAHVMHCHGTSDCATMGGAEFALSAQPATLPVPSIVSLRFESAAQALPEAAFISPPSEPPQAA